MFIKKKVIIDVITLCTYLYLFISSEHEYVTELLLTSMTDFDEILYVSKWSLDMWFRFTIGHCKLNSRRYQLKQGF